MKFWLDSVIYKNNFTYSIIAKIKIRPEITISFRGGLCYSAKVKSTLPVGTFAAEHITFTLSPTE